MKEKFTEMINKYKLTIGFQGRGKNQNTGIMVGVDDNLLARNPKDREFIVKNKPAIMETIESLKVLRRYPEKVKEAAETGVNVFICRWDTPCDGSEEECNTDIISQYVTPDGKIITVRNHMY